MNWRKIERVLKYSAVMVIVGLLASALAGCQTTGTERRVIGAVVGAAAGAIIADEFGDGNNHNYGGYGGGYRNRSWLDRGGGVRGAYRGGYEDGWRRGQRDLERDARDRGRDDGYSCRIYGRNCR